MVQYPLMALDSRQCLLDPSLNQPSCIKLLHPSYSLLVKLKQRINQAECWKITFFNYSKTNQTSLLISTHFLISNTLLTLLINTAAEKNKGMRTSMKIDKEFSHPIHPQHKLRLEYTEIPFNCDGCKEAGIGLKYKCQQCEFDLHKGCAVAPPSITHPFYNKCEFQLYYQSPGPDMRICDACRNDVLGFVYHCKRCGFDLHPCCANLPQVLDDGERNLYLCLKLSSSCHRCGGRGPGWSYRSQCKTYNLHVSCVKELLVESWQAKYLNVDKNKVTELQTRIPSLKGTAGNPHMERGGKVRKSYQMAGSAVRVIASAILGDPTAIISAVVGGLISK